MVDLWTIDGGIPRFEFSTLSQFMDAKFLKVLRNEPSRMKEIFHEMAIGMTGDEFAGFLSPNFAATVISLDNFENIFDLCLSALPFLCLIPAQ